MKSPQPRFVRCTAFPLSDAVIAEQNLSFSSAKPQERMAGLQVWEILEVRGRVGGRETVGGRAREVLKWYPYFSEWVAGEWLEELRLTLQF